MQMKKGGTLIPTLVAPQQMVELVEFLYSLSQDLTSLVHKNNNPCKKRALSILSYSSILSMLKFLISISNALTQSLSFIGAINESSSIVSITDSTHISFVHCIKWQIFNVTYLLLCFNFIFPICMTTNVVSMDGMSLKNMIGTSKIHLLIENDKII